MTRRCWTPRSRPCWPAAAPAELDASYAAYDAAPLDVEDDWGDLASFREAAAAS